MKTLNIIELNVLLFLQKDDERNDNSPLIGV